MGREEKIQKLIAIKELQISCTAVLKLMHPKDVIEKGFEVEKGLTFTGFAPTVHITFYRMGYRAYINDRLKLSDSWQDTHDEVLDMFLSVAEHDERKKKRRHATIRKNSRGSWGKTTDSKIARENWFASCLSG